MGGILFGPGTRGLVVEGSTMCSLGRGGSASGCCSGRRVVVSGVWY